MRAGHRNSAHRIRQLDLAMKIAVRTPAETKLRRPAGKCDDKDLRKGQTEIEATTAGRDRHGRGGPDDCKRWTVEGLSHGHVKTGLCSDHRDQRGVAGPPVHRPQQFFAPALIARPRCRLGLGVQQPMRRSYPGPSLSARRRACRATRSFEKLQGILHLCRIDNPVANTPLSAMPRMTFGVVVAVTFAAGLDCPAEVFQEHVDGAWPFKRAKHRGEPLEVAGELLLSTELLVHVIVLPELGLVSRRRPADSGHAVRNRGRRELVTLPLPALWYRIATSRLLSLPSP